MEKKAPSARRNTVHPILGQVGPDLSYRDVVMMKANHDWQTGGPALLAELDEIIQTDRCGSEFPAALMALAARIVRQETYSQEATLLLESMRDFFIDNRLAGSGM